MSSRASVSNDSVSGQQQLSRYRHDPYARDHGVFWYGDDSRSTYVATPNDISPVGTSAPIGTRHLQLWGRVTFIPYPEEEFVAPPAPKAAAGELVRAFIGQLPYFVTDMQLAWMCYTLGGGHVVSYPERIIKRQPSGEKLPTGCIHAYASESAVCAMAARMHKRMLVDDTGVWHAQNDEELRELSSYVAELKSDKSRRVPGRPYDTVVVQLATSTFVPRNVAAKPHLALRAISETADVTDLPAARSGAATSTDAGSKGAKTSLRRGASGNAAAVPRP